jgi:hypothetical protein
MLEPTLLDEFEGYQAWRWDLRIHQSAHFEKAITYRIDLPSSWLQRPSGQVDSHQFFIPALHRPFDWSFYHGNYSSQTSFSKTRASPPYGLWDIFQAVYHSQPHHCHLLVGLGNQISMDHVWTTVAEVAGWLRVLQKTTGSDRQAQLNKSVEADTRHSIQKFYFTSYLTQFGVSILFMREVLSNSCHDVIC